jgi:hypothetical protein
MRALAYSVELTELLQNNKRSARRGDYADACKICYFQLVTVHEAVLPPHSWLCINFDTIFMPGVDRWDSAGCQMTDEFPPFIIECRNIVNMTLKMLTGNRQI